MHMARNTRTTKQAIKTCSWIWTMKCTWEKIGLPLLPELTITSSFWYLISKNQSEQERTQILTIVMLSLENPRPAGYTLTRNWSMFLETDGSWAWLYHCPLGHSPLHTVKQCYDRIPIVNEGQIQFVDPITRLIHPAANLLTYKTTDRIKNLFQFDMDQEDSW